MANDAGKSIMTAGRRPYRSPSLVTYGSVAKLTQGTFSTNNDGGVGGMMAGACL